MEGIELTTGLSSALIRSTMPNPPEPTDAQLSFRVSGRRLYELIALWEHRMAILNRDYQSMKSDGDSPLAAGIAEFVLESMKGMTNELREVVASSIPPRNMEDN